MAKFLGVDTGGTFTDFILFDDESKAISTHKVLSTPESPDKAILQGIYDLTRADLSKADLSVADANLMISQLTIVHGSTVATNAILEGKGVRTAYITNKGLADVLSIGRQAREELYNLTPIKKPPLIEPELCIEVNSRLSAQGEHLQRLNEQDLAELIKQLKALAPKAVAINLLFSFFDDAEELKIEQAIIKQFGADGVFISRSSDVLPEYKEFERGMTTTLNAKVGPLMQGYLKNLQVELNGCALSIMQSSGGTTSAEQAGNYPVNLLLSGPAGGLIGAQTVAAASGEQRLLSFDMGGTSTDVSIIDKEIGFTTGAKIGGYPVAVPMVDMYTIGAGGGSIAQVDAGGLLLVGPESAGADPGPACYGRGSSQATAMYATVTDANVVLGRILPQSFLGGDMTLDKDAAITAIRTIADALSLTVEQAAQGILDVVNDHMVRALRVMSVERGEDPKDFTLVSFGGAGGLHVCALAEELEMKKALVPVNAGILSALGMLAAKASRERSRTINKLLNACSENNIEKIFFELVTQAKQEINPGFLKDGVSPLSVEINQSIDVRYQGQSHALNLPWSGLQNIENAFHQKHKESYGHELEVAIELVNARVRVIGQGQSFVLPKWRPTRALKETYTSMPGISEPVLVINREGMEVGQTIKGPALITEISSTTWLAIGWTAVVDITGNFLLAKE